MKKTKELINSKMKFVLLVYILKNNKIINA